MSSILAEKLRELKESLSFIDEVCQDCYVVEDEEELTESAPPDKEIEDWIVSVKPEFKKQYGSEWEKVLYAKAWKQYKEKHNLSEEALTEARIKIRVTSRGQKLRRIKCPPGRILKTVNGVKQCVTPSGRQRLVKKLAAKQMVRTKRAKGTGAAKRANFRRQRAIKRRKAFGLRSGQ